MAQSPGLCAGLGRYFYQRQPGRPASRQLLTFPAMLALKLSGLFGGALLAIFTASLAVEDQRHFVACRASGASVDACLLQISGR